MKTKNLFIILILVSTFFSCSPEREIKDKVINWSKDKSSEMNKNFALEEELDIKMFLANRSSWKTTTTGSGLRYAIYKNGIGDKAFAGLIAQVKYKINLLDGTLCYETNVDEIESFEIDKSDVETGVQEGIKKLRIGDKAKFIIPSHLAHGLLGDNDKIPPLTVLVIDIELVGLVAK